MPLELLRWIYAVALTVTLAMLLWSRAWRTLPAFTAYVALGLAATVLHFRIEQWSPESWITWGRILIVVRCAVAIEIAFWRSPGVPMSERIAAIVALAAIPAVILALARMAPDGSRIFAAAVVARHVESAILLFLLAAALMFWRIGFPVAPMISRHSWLFFALMLNQLAGVSAWQIWPPTARGWNGRLAASYAVGIMCFTVWPIIIDRRGVIDRRGASAPPPASDHQ